jgi:hypothetical protein
MDVGGATCVSDEERSRGGEEERRRVLVVSLGPVADLPHRCLHSHLSYHQCH